MRKIALIIVLAFMLAGCGVDGRSLGTTWVDLPDGKGRVLCAGAESGGIDCDWDHAERSK